MKPSRAACVILLFALTTAAWAPVAAGASSRLASRLHGDAVQLFRAGRVPEAYGRFVQLAEAGHPASARYALWMCQHGLALFGSDWDCAPHEIEDWARTAGITVASPGLRCDLPAARLPVAGRR